MFAPISFAAQPRNSVAAPSNKSAMAAKMPLAIMQQTTATRRAASLLAVGDSVHFSGKLATEAAKKGNKEKKLPLTQSELNSILNKDDNPYIDTLSDSLLAGEPKELWFATLDNLAARIRQGFSDPPSLGTGKYGTVYHIGIGGKPYALKVFKQENGEPEHSPYQEAATGAYLTHHNITKDVVRFYAANPQQGWVLTEYIKAGPSITRERPGITRTAGGICIEDGHEDNAVAGVRVDLGGAVSRLSESVIKASQKENKSNESDSSGWGIQLFTWDSLKKTSNKQE